MRARSKVIVVALSAATILAMGGWAMAGSKASSHVSRPASTVVRTAATVRAPTHVVQRGSTTRRAEIGSESSEASNETATETSVEEPGDQNLPGGGHADPTGQDVQHEFNGVE